MTAVVDASVALKWVIEEDGSEAALALLRNETLIAPDFLLVECGNVLWTKARRGIVKRDQAEAGLRAILSVPIELLPSAEYTLAAQTIAFDLAQTVYDSLYLATALAERSILVTADRKFASAAAAHGVYRAAVKPLLG